MDNDLVKRELAIYGVLFTDGDCIVIENNARNKVSVHVEKAKLKESVKEKRQLFNELWGELVDMLSGPPMSIAPGSEATRRMFTEALKHLFSISLMLKLKRSQKVIKVQLKRDINSFSESYMTKIVDYKIGLDWVLHLAKSDRYRLELLESLTGDDDAPLEVQAISGPWANLDLPMKERVWNYSEERENIEDHELSKQKQQRYQLPATYNDPYEFEEGFYYREMRNEPFAWEDRLDDSPYPHRNLLDDK